MFIYSGAKIEDAPHRVTLELDGSEGIRTFEINQDFGVSVMPTVAVLRLAVLSSHPNWENLSEEEKELVGKEGTLRILEVIPWNRIKSLKFEYPANVPDVLQ